MIAGLTRRMGRTVSPAANAAATQCTVSVSAATLVNDNSTTISIAVFAVNANGSPVAGATVVVTRSPASGTVTQPVAVTDANGLATATFKSASVAAYTFSATVNGIPVTDTDTCTTFSSIGAIDRTTSTVTVSPSSQAAGGVNALITLQAKDAAGVNLITAGSTVAFSHAGGTSVVTIGSVTDNGDGTYTAPITPTTEGTATTLSATIAAAAVTTTMPTFTVTSGYVAANILSNASFESGVDGFTDSGLSPLSSGFRSTLYAEPTDAGSYSLKNTFNQNIWAITGVATGNPCVVTAPGHGITTGLLPQISGTTTTPSINQSIGGALTATKIDANTFSVNANVTAVSVGTGLVAKEVSGIAAWYMWSRKVGAAPIGTSVDRYWLRFYFLFPSGPYLGRETKWVRDYDNSFSQLGGMFGMYGTAITGTGNMRLNFQPWPEFLSVTKMFAVSNSATMHDGNWHSIELDMWRNGDVSNGGFDYPSAAIWLDNVQVTGTEGTAVTGLGAPSKWIGGRINYGQRTVTTKVGGAEIMGVVNTGNPSALTCHFDRISYSTAGRIGP